MSRVTLILACTTSTLAAQPPVPPPVSTDLNAGVPSDWSIVSLSNAGWNWGSAVGYAGTGGLIMDCAACSSYEETTLWSPWLDLTNDGMIEIGFQCAIIGGSLMLPPPVWVQRDGVGGPAYVYRYGTADLIPPPDEVIPSTNNPFPPLDMGNVQWVSITYPFYAGLNNDSVRIGIGTGVPLGGYALLDEVTIGNLSTFAPAEEASDLLVLRTESSITLRSMRPIDRLEVIDLCGRVLRHQKVGATEAQLPLDGLVGPLHLVRLWRSGVPAVVRVAR
ncbi:MAG: hypothetical protein IT229_10470 [Flavobacteriales bacterium]|nr:hypothetical protein [Flavobacteriales bacterium]